MFASCRDLQTGIVGLGFVCPRRLNQTVGLVLEQNENVL